MRSSKWLENVELKPFDKSDWNLLAGAESPYPDQEPLIGYAIPAFDWQEKYPEDEEIIIVVDKNGVGVIGLDVQFSHPCSFEEGIRVAQRLPQHLGLRDLRGWNKVIG